MNTGLTVQTKQTLTNKEIQHKIQSPKANITRQRLGFRDEEKKTFGLTEQHPELKVALFSFM